MASEENPYQEGKRAGAHPVAVVLVVILGLWIFIWVFIPSSKQRQPGGPDSPQATGARETDAAGVMFKVAATVPDINAISVVVPKEATNSQIAGLLNRFREARLNQTLSDMVPATTPGNKLGSHAVADIYVFSDPQHAVADAVKVLSRGAHAPGELYPQAIPFEIAMEHVRGHYRIDLNDTGHPDQASIGFADESGVHSKHYKKIF
jgi:hypothetical protein